MKRSFGSILCRSAASALFACMGVASAEAGPETTTSLPQWVLRAQARLGLTAGQQVELRALVDENSARLCQLQVRYAGRNSPAAHRAQRDEMAAVQRQFRDGLGTILTATQLATWDALLEELLGEVHMRNTLQLAAAAH
jgi:hypothetical protein